MKTQFDLYQVSFDGEHVLDSVHNTLDAAENASANLGSKWIFYPLSVIVKGQTIIETGGEFVTKDGEPLLSFIFKGKRFKTLMSFLAKESKKEDAQGLDYIEFEAMLLNTLAS